MNIGEKIAMKVFQRIASKKSPLVPEMPAGSSWIVTPSGKRSIVSRLPVGGGDGSVDGGSSLGEVDKLLGRSLVMARSRSKDGYIVIPWIAVWDYIFALPRRFMKAANFLVVVASCVIEFAGVRAAEEPGFEALFDGKTLSGWEGNEKIFRVEEGAIVAGSSSEAIAHNEFLASREEFGDFELRLKARLVGQGQNAGVQFRSQRVADHFEMIGYQCDMGSMRGKPIWGALYDESRRRKFLVEPPEGKLVGVLKADDWNELVIRCEGPLVQIWVNGVQTVDFTEMDESIPRTGKLGLQIHGGQPAVASYKDIRVRRL
jgi:hypothetical protein